MTTLTPRQLEILRMQAEGLTNRQIAQRLWIAENTMKSHVKAMRKKLESATSAQAVAVAYERGILVSRQLDSARAWAVELEQENAARDAELRFIVSRRLADGSGAYFGTDRCTGISSCALAYYGVGHRAEPEPHEYPRDESDLAACERTYDMAPPHVREQMLPVLVLYRESVAKGAA